ncbi:formate/nitrite transporter [Gemella bergeri ATCC 700627]|uniref:Formate/nitrite transporter n=1 Tax=Gemella bergeri ATCC 700627 TaxID=1321820 RepID=U2SD96_9BACL|nr:formate/nitrite transporter family protein [Gemella bergeri]ERK60697.1 formate/nitrite transporter [Gemella bergeri ATCC 700627]
MAEAMHTKAYLEPQELYEYTSKKGVMKATGSLKYMLSLGFLGGAFIAVGYLAYLRVAGSIPHEWAGLGVLLGAAVFPIGLICILVGGGELITSNMMAVTLAFFNKKVSLKLLVKNLIIITLANLVGAVFVAYFLGHVTGLTEGVIFEKTLVTAEAKINSTFWQGIFSGIGCNWLVGMGAWLSFCAKDVSGKILGTWFPIMTFVAVGFQHVVANMFVIPAAMFGGANITFAQFAENMGVIFLGNFLGGAILVAGLYTLAYKKKTN